MKLVKSLLLGSAAGLVAVAGASAADLGVKKPTAVEYVKTCPTYGAGFFVVPGTTSCLKIIGRVRLDYIFDNPRLNTGNGNRFRARGYVGFDHRTATEYGLLRTYVRAFFQRENAADSTTLEYAFIQFGGLTAGRVTPIFEHGWNQFYMFSGQGGIGYHSDISYTNSIGYTQSFGGGFSATIAIDDSRERRLGITGGAIGGTRMPDIVGSLAYDQSWGSLKLSGSVFQVRNANAAVDTKYGFAVEGAAKFNLPMLTKGSNIWVAGGYSQGSVSYNGFGAFTMGSFTVTPVDAVVAGGALRLTTSYAFMGAAEVYFTPTISASLGGTFAEFNPSGANNSVRTYSVIGQVAWRPVAGFLIGVEGAYRKLSFDAGAATVVNTSAGGTKRDDFVGRIRFQRDF
ncbi:MAG: porin [Beijerinckiaceae bacterium]|nr:porin [Beijerinckiaceae bacterium]MCZ8301596.1 porin [Beijerinckiaceae bacterium]